MGHRGVVDPDQQSAWIAHYEIVQAGLAASNNLQFQTWWAWGDATIGVVRNATVIPLTARTSVLAVVILRQVLSQLAASY